MTLPPRRVWSFSKQCTVPSGATMNAGIFCARPIAVLNSSPSSGSRHSPHCLKKNGTPAPWHWSRRLRAQSGCIGLAPGPLSPPTMTQSSKSRWIGWSRASCPDQEGRKGSEEGVPENLSVPLEGDRDFGELCGSHQGCQVPFRPPIPNVGLLLRRCSGKGLHLAMTGEPRGFSRVTAGFSSYDGEFRMPLVLAQASPIFHSSCEGKLGIALE